MDLYTELSKNMKDVVALVNTKILAFDTTLDEKLGKASTSSSSDLSQLKSDYKDFKEFVWKTLSLLQRQIELLIAGYDKHESLSRRKILLFHGLQEENQEQLEDRIINVIHKHIKLPSIVHSDIQLCHRLGAKGDKPRPILVRFGVLKCRNQVWTSKSQLKGSGVTLSEFLTKPRQEVFVAARKHFGVGHCWSADGHIVVLLPDKNRKKIVSMTELLPLIEKYPAQKPQETKQIRSRRPLKK